MASSPGRGAHPVPKRSLADARRWLLSLGAPEGEILRALRLARRAALARLGPRSAVVIVPSQRLGLLPPRRPVAHEDLAALLRGGHALTTAEAGRLPVEEQRYPVHVTPQGASCPCPASRLAGDPLCVHRLAAAVKLYTIGRDDLLSWLPAAIEEKRKWARLRSRRRRAPPPGTKPLTAHGKPAGRGNYAEDTSCREIGPR